MAIVIALVLIPAASPVAENAGDPAAKPADDSAATNATETAANAPEEAPAENPPETDGQPTAIPPSEHSAENPATAAPESADENATGAPRESGDEAPATTPTSATKKPTPTSSKPSAPAAPMQQRGLLGWGVTLDVPMVGVFTGRGNRSRVGWGYHLGTAVSWRLHPTLDIRLGAATAGTTMGEAPLRYLDNGELQRARQEAGWSHYETTLGATYSFTDNHRPYTFFIGLDGGYRLAGFIFSRNREPVDSLTTTTIDSLDNEGTVSSLESSWLISLRLGAEMAMLRWLATVAELHGSYLYRGRVPVSDTRPLREVRAAPEHIFLLRAVFSFRLML